MIDEFVGKTVLVRCKGAGVHVGTLESAIVRTCKSSLQVAAAVFATVLNSRRRRRKIAANSLAGNRRF